MPPSDPDRVYPPWAGTLITVPTIWARSGLVELVMVTVEHDPAPLGAVWLETRCSLWVAGFHHWTPSPAVTPQTVNCTSVNWLPGEMETS